MSHSPFTVGIADFAVRGRIVQDLIDLGASVVVLVCPGDTSTQSPLLKGAKIATVDYADVSSLVSILREHDIEAIISVSTCDALPVQQSIAAAVQETGIDLFVLSGYGALTEVASKKGHLAAKLEFSDYVKSLMIPIMHAYNDAFMEFVQLSVADIGPGMFDFKDKPTIPLSLGGVSGSITSALTIPSSSFLHRAMTCVPGEHMFISSAGSLHKAPDPFEAVSELPGRLVTNELAYTFCSIM